MEGGKFEVLRIPEPFVDVGRINSPVSQVFSGVAAFTLTYPDGAYDAESSDGRPDLE